MKALVVETPQFGVEDGIVLGENTGEQQQRRDEADPEGQQARHRHGGWEDGKWNAQSSAKSAE